MTDQTTIALDGMGGDNAPQAVIEGAEIARQKYPDIRFLIFGNQEVLQAEMAKFPELNAISDIRHTDEVVGPEDKPAHAMRRGRGSSMGLAIEAVRSGEASVAVSSGNTGALMGMAKIILRTLPGIDRPALVTTLPTLNDDVVMLDVGANVECSDDNLVQFAIMGAEFARAVLGRSRPVVALLNVGVEEVKGNGAVRSASEKLKNLEGAFDFGGFVEGDGIAKGEVDVIVTDGFTGNIALKTVEGTAHMLGGFLARAFRSSILSRIGYLASIPALKVFRERMDPRAYNGGVFLGLNGLVVKSHGGTDAVGFSSAVAMAALMASDGLSERILRNVKTLSDIDRPETARQEVGE